MPFWSTNFAEDPTLNDPKRKFRFMVEFNNINAEVGGQQMWYASTVSKPGFTINAAEHKYLNHTFYYPGNVSWAPVTMTLVDPVNPDMTATLSDLIEVSGYAPPTLEDGGMATISKAKASNALGTVYVIQLDANGVQLEKWTLYNAFITDVKFGDMSYGDDGLQEISLELRYDWGMVEVENKSSLRVDPKSAGNVYFKG
jgi:hypothetical protein